MILDLNSLSKNFQLMIKKVLQCVFKAYIFGNLRKRFKNKIILFKIRRYKKIQGFLSSSEAIALYDIASKLPAGSIIVEIGSWKGKSTYCLARGLRKGKVIAIDPFDASGDEDSVKIYQQTKGKKSLIDQFREQMQRLKVMKKIEILEGYSSWFVGKIPRIDLLFIDGNHSKEAVSLDFNNYQTFIPSGGYIALHDYDPYRKDFGPTWVVDNIIMPSGKFEFVGLIKSLWVGKKL